MRIEDVLKELRSTMTIILVTNLVQQARRLADRTAFLFNGELVEVDRTDVIFSDGPANRKTLRVRERDLRMSQAPPGDYTIETRDLNLWYGDFQALKDVDLDVRHGQIIGLIGPSGCGKTTLLRCFNRINERYGYVTHDRRNHHPRPEHLRRRTSRSCELRKAVGMVFQRPNPLPISVYENVVFGLRIHNGFGRLGRAQLDEAVEKALSEVSLWDDLKDRLHTRATTLQLEQQQKLCIARLLPLKPEVILMDEPCSALDTEATLGIEELMLTLAGRYTILIVTHNMAQARRVSDECIFMLLGEIVEHSRTEDLFLTPRDPRTADYIEGRYG